MKITVVDGMRTIVYDGPCSHTQGPARNTEGFALQFADPGEARVECTRNNGTVEMIVYVSEDGGPDGGGSGR
jgi:hypothetical protein